MEGIEMAKQNNNSIKDSDTYAALRDQGVSKEKAARIANAKAAGTLKHDSSKLESRTKQELYEEAKQIGIEGRSKMNKLQLVAAIRSH